MNLGTSIKKVREHLGMKQKTLAEKLKISSTALSLIEGNKSIPKKATYDKILDVLGVPSSYLHFLALDKEDIPKDKQELYAMCYSQLEVIMKNLITKQEYTNTNLK